MKSTRAAQSSVDISNLSVPDAEEIIEEALGGSVFQDPGLVRALRFLAPPGYQAIVELCSENGRSKRRNASADDWSPEEDEVRIDFERIDDAEPGGRQSRGSRASVEPHFHEREDEDDEPRFRQTSTPALKSYAPPLPRPNVAVTPSLLSNGSATIFAAQGIPLEPAP